MIKKLKTSKKDVEKIKSLAVNPNSLKNDFFHYAGIVIKKPWGYEYLIFENKHVAVWVLYIQHGFQTSLHCHPSKKTSLTVLSGEALCSTLNQKTKVRPGEGLLIDKGVFHSTQALSKEGIVIMETETPNNKRDLVRLDDKYGREHKGYEGKQHHVSLGDLDYLSLESFHEGDSRYGVEKKIGNCFLKVVRHSDSKSIEDIIKNSGAHMVGVLKGTLHSSKNPILAHGDIALLSDLNKKKNLGILDEVELLFIKNTSPKKKKSN